MRRISILMVILSITVSANANIQIGVNGLLNPSEITLSPSETAAITIWTSGVISNTADNFYGFLGVPDGQPGSISWSQFPPIIQPAISIVQPSPESPIPGYSSWIEFYYAGIDPILPGSILIDGIDFHCEGVGDVDLTMLTTVDFTYLVPNDVQVFHQIPEPATIALLGLGVILLKRRR